MINSTAFTIAFFYKGKLLKYQVDKMYISYNNEHQDFYRLGADSGNRDLVKVKGKWIVISGPPLRPQVVELVGQAIEISILLSMPNLKEKKGFH